MKYAKDGAFKNLKWFQVENAFKVVGKSSKVEGKGSKKGEWWHLMSLSQELNFFKPSDFKQDISIF